MLRFSVALQVMGGVKKKKNCCEPFALKPNFMTCEKDMP